MLTIPIINLLKKFVFVFVINQSKIIVKEDIFEKDLLQITIKMIYRGDRFPGKIRYYYWKSTVFCYFLAYIFLIFFKICILNLSYVNFIIDLQSWLKQHSLSKMICFCIVFGLDILQVRPALKILNILMSFVQKNILRYFFRGTCGSGVKFCNKKKTTILETDFYHNGLHHYE